MVQALALVAAVEMGLALASVLMLREVGCRVLLHPADPYSGQFVEAWPAERHRGRPL